MQYRKGPDGPFFYLSNYVLTHILAFSEVVISISAGFEMKQYPFFIAECLASRKTGPGSEY